MLYVLDVVKVMMVHSSIHCTCTAVTCIDNGGIVSIINNYLYSLY